MAITYDPGLVSKAYIPSRGTGDALLQSCPNVKRTYVRAAGCGVLLSSWLVAALIPIQGCFDNGTCVTMSLLNSKAGFSEYWKWDYRWGLRIVAVVTGVAAVLTAFALTSRSNRSGAA